MTNQHSIQFFEQQAIRRIWDKEKEEWYFSVIDVVSILTDQTNYQSARKYWNKLKERLSSESAQLVTFCHQLKLASPKDGKKYLTDVATTEQLLRIIQSIPSKKAEPFKLWLAQVGKERIDETIDPEKAIDRALATYLRKGYDQGWINQRVLSIRVRKELTDEWDSHGVKKGKEYAILTDEITKTWAGLTTREYKNLKGLKKENLRDNMSTTEIILNMLAETSTKDIIRKEQPIGLGKNRLAAHRGGNVANIARQALEQETGESPITPQNALDLHRNSKTLPQ